MDKPSLRKADLTAALERAGILLTPDQLRDLMPGVEIVQKLIERVNVPLPHEAEPAVMFDPDKQR